MSDEKEMKYFKVFSGILGKGGAIYFCFAADKTEAKDKFRRAYAGREFDEVYAVETKG